MYFQRGGDMEPWTQFYQPGYTSFVASTRTRTIQELLAPITESTVVPTMDEIKLLDANAKRIYFFLTELLRKEYFTKPIDDRQILLETLRLEFPELKTLLKEISIRDTESLYDSNKFDKHIDRKTDILAYYFKYLARYHMMYKDFITKLLSSPYKRLIRAICTNKQSFMHFYAQISSIYNDIDVSVRTCPTVGGGRKQSKRSTKRRSSRAKKTRRAQ
jgi:hypothetical protein